MPRPTPAQSTLRGDVLALLRDRRLLGLLALGFLLRVVVAVTAHPDALAEDMSLFQRSEQIDSSAAVILAVKSYLDGAELREGDSELAMDRLSILEQLDLDNLLAAPHLWASLKTLFDWFKSRYRALYLSHHQDYHRGLSSLRGRLDRAQPEVKALGLLNTIAELGEPLLGLQPRRLTLAVGLGQGGRGLGPRLRQPALHPRHAQASRVTVELHATPKAVTLQIADNGRGFDPSAVQIEDTMGLQGIRERLVGLGGTLTVDSAPGEGTRLVVHLPRPKSTEEGESYV